MLINKISASELRVRCWLGKFQSHYYKRKRKITRLLGYSEGKKIDQEKTLEVLQISSSPLPFLAPVQSVIGSFTCALSQWGRSPYCPLHKKELNLAWEKGGGGGRERLAAPSSSLLPPPIMTGGREEGKKKLGARKSQFLITGRGAAGCPTTNGGVQEWELSWNVHTHIAYAFKEVG